MAKGNQLMLHSGGREATREMLDTVPLPEKTDTYFPVSHFDLVTRLITIATDLIPGYSLVSEKYGLARDGQQMFAALAFAADGETEMRLALGARNSYDQSMAIGFAMGGSVFVCDNLALSGEVVVLRKHTKRVWEEIEELAIMNIYKAKNRYFQIKEDAESMKRIAMDDNRAFELMGLAYGNNLISPRQLPVMKEAWIKPAHAEFEPRNLWSLYNAGTQALKTAPPSSIMERHIDLHSMMLSLT